MTIRAWLALGLVAGLAACGTPQTQCQRAATADLRALDAKIAATERDVARGYWIIPEQLPATRLSLCNWPKEPVLFCTEPLRDPVAEQRVPVDRAQAAQELAALGRERATVAAQAAAAQQRCI